MGQEGDKEIGDMQCPGQDRRYWTPDAVYEVPCPQCGANVELFKDEGSGRCTLCGHRFPNPGANFGCAAWCSLAQECLGFRPESTSPAGSSAGALAARLILAVKEEWAKEPARLAHAVSVYQYARDLVAKEGGDPRVVLAAALLLHTGSSRSAVPSSQPGVTSAKARNLLHDIGLDETLIERVCQIIDDYQAGRDRDTCEYKVVCDSDGLARRGADYLKSPPEKQLNFIKYLLKTAAGKEKAQGLLGGPNRATWGGE
jgi:hypothetical protein